MLTAVLRFRYLILMPLSVDDNFQEKIRIKAIPLGFKKDVRGILPAITSATLVNGSAKYISDLF